MAAVTKYEGKNLAIKRVLPFVFENDNSWSIINDEIHLRKEDLNKDKYIEIQYEQNYYVALEEQTVY